MGHIRRGSFFLYAFLLYHAPQALYFFLFFFLHLDLILHPSSCEQRGSNMKMKFAKNTLPQWYHTVTVMIVAHLIKAYRPWSLHNVFEDEEE